MDLTGMGWDRMGWGGMGWECSSSVGVQGEGQFDTAELLPAIADDHADTVVAIGHPGRELHIGHIKIAGWQRVGALWREGTDRQEVNQKPSPAPKGTVVPTGTASITRGPGHTALKGQWQGMP